MPSLPRMTKVFGKLCFGVALLLTAQTVSAHPGHEATDVVAQVSHPLAGLDHLLAFVGLSACLLGLLALALHVRRTPESAPSPTNAADRRRAFAFAVAGHSARLQK